MKSEEIIQAVLQVQSAGYCQLCDQRAKAVGIWRPTRAIMKKLNAPANKDRLVVYGMCELHAQKKFLPDIEKKIVHDVQQMTNHERN